MEGTQFGADALRMLAFRQEETAAGKINVIVVVDMVVVLLFII